MKSNATKDQINEFIKFIADMAKNSGTELTDENKAELREAFNSLVRTAKSEALRDVAVKVRELHDEIINK